MEENERPEGEEPLHALFLRCSSIISRRIGRSATRRRIIALLDERGELTQCELQKNLGIQAGSLSELVSRMEKFGVLEREADSRDKRRLVLRLTEEGKRRAAQPVEMGDDRLFAALNAEEREELRRMLRKIDDAHTRWRRENP